MAHILIMPRQGNTVESCIIVDWKVKEGDQVTAETTICEVETDKASFEVPAGSAGTVLKLFWNAGDDVPVLEPIAVIGETGEDWQADPKTGISQENSRKDTEAQRDEKADEPEKAAPEIFQVSYVSSGLEKFISPRARNLAEKEALSFETVPGTGPDGRIIERDVLLALKNRPAMTAAAKAAGAGAIPQQGSGIGGRVTVSDLAQPGQTPSMPEASLPQGEGAVTETPIRGIRRIISDKMLKSLSQTAQFTLNASAMISRLQEIRSRMKTQESFSGDIGLSKITVNDLVLFAVSRTLIKFPFMNAHLTGETIKTFERVHLGVAVDTPRGLMVPVIRNANLLSLAQISSEMKRLSAACQGGSVKPDELSGSTFSISSLGSLGIASFTPVINIPEVAILGVCAIEMKPVQVSQSETCECNCRCRFEPHIGFSLTINHQAVDGAPAARFLKALCEAVTNIDLLLAAG